MATLIARVKSTLFIRSSRRSLHALDGAYASLLHGRSLDFEDLRAFEPGDQVRDIDWRATARQGTPLVRRFHATRMHTVLFVVDTGRSMGALAPDERPKRELAILATGVLGMLTLRHGNDFAAVYGDAARVRRLPRGRSESTLEHALRTISVAIDESDATSDREALLSHVTRTVTRRMIVVVITDEAPVSAEGKRTLRRLRAQHDVLWITVRDADPVLDHATRRTRSDADSHWDVPAFVQGDPAIVEELAAQNRAASERLAETLKNLDIGHAVIDGQDNAVAQLLQLLNRRSHARL